VLLGVLVVPYGVTDINRAGDDHESARDKHNAFCQIVYFLPLPRATHARVAAKTSIHQGPVRPSPAVQIAKQGGEVAGLHER
jgi:hypothetical protein